LDNFWICVGWSRNFPRNFKMATFVFLLPFPMQRHKKERISYLVTKKQPCHQFSQSCRFLTTQTEFPPTVSVLPKKGIIPYQTVYSVKFIMVNLNNSLKQIENYKIISILEIFYKLEGGISIYDNFQVWKIEIDTIWIEEISMKISKTNLSWKLPTG
jgi:hypothetical protein